MAISISKELRSSTWPFEASHQLGKYILIANPSDKEMLIAVAILCSFELMDAPGDAWRTRLGALPLFSNNTTFLPVQSTTIIPRTAIKKPMFWSFARQDFLCACKLLDTWLSSSCALVNHHSHKRDSDTTEFEGSASLEECRSSHG